MRTYSYLSNNNVIDMSQISLKEIETIHTMNNIVTGNNASTKVNNDTHLSYSFLSTEQRNILTNNSNTMPYIFF